MYESEAYEILHIKRGSSQEEIKEAYAALSKKYHPEEHPDEFQQIHEAYMTLRRRSRGQRSERRNPEQEPKTIEAEDASVGEAAEKVSISMKVFGAINLRISMIFSLLEYL